MIHKSVVVAVPPERAFASWHRNIHLWWPPGHHVSGDPAGRMVLEPKQGGRFYERAPDGTEHDYGQVLVFEAPHRLVYSFFLGTGRALPTEVEVCFTAVDDGTRVDVTHRPGRAGDAFGRTAPRFRASWDHTLAAFAAHLRPEPA